MKLLMLQKGRPSNFATKRRWRPCSGW